MCRITFITDMNFAVQKCISGSSLARLGRVTFQEVIALTDANLDSHNGNQSNGTSSSSPELIYDSPMCMQYTRSGGIPHVVWELADHLLDGQLPVLVTLPESIGMKEQVKQSKGTLASYAMISSKRPVFTIVQDPTKVIRTGQNDSKGVSVWTSRGRLQFNAEDYLGVQEIFKPHAFQVLCDGDTPAVSSKKRLAHSVTRTLDYLDKSLILQHDSDFLRNQCALFATIEGGYDLKTRLMSAKQTALRPVTGYVLEGFHPGGFEVSLNIEEIRPILIEVMKLLPKDKPKAFFGPFPPDTMFELIKLGVDIFDTSYATCLSEKGIAMITKVDTITGITSTKLLDLTQDEFKKDFTVIEKDCECYACTRNFSKVYINHLLNTKEMLSAVLLMLHNVYVLCNWFRTIRKCLNSDTFIQNA